jgi:hypothetical protein
MLGCAARLYRYAMQDVKALQESLLENSLSVVSRVESTVMKAVAMVSSNGDGSDNAQNDEEILRYDREIRLDFEQNTRAGLSPDKCGPLNSPPPLMSEPESNSVSWRIGMKTAVVVLLTTVTEVEAVKISWAYRNLLPVLITKFVFLACLIYLLIISMCGSDITMD